MLNALVTGGNGFLGQYVCRSLLRKGYGVTTLGRTRGDLICDLSKSVPRLNDDYDLVVHCAGLAHYKPVTASDGERFFRTNEQGTQNLLRSLTENSVCLVYISSVSVYGLKQGESINESYALNGQTPYALSKIRAEELVANWASKRKLPWGILRLPLVIGEAPPGNLGAMISALKNKRYFRIGAGNAQKSMVLAEDVGEVIPRLSEKGGIFNLTDGCHPSMLELEDCLTELMRLSPVRSLPTIVAKSAALIGDFIDKFPLNRERFNQITNTLTFSDLEAQQRLDWRPRPVLQNLSQIFS